MIESGQVLEKGSSEYRNNDRIWASTRRIRVSTRKVIESGQVLEEFWRVPEK